MPGKPLLKVFITRVLQQIFSQPNCTSFMPPAEKKSVRNKRVSALFVRSPLLHDAFLREHYRSLNPHNDKTNSEEFETKRRSSFRKCIQKIINAGCASLCISKQLQDGKIFEGPYQHCVGQTAKSPRFRRIN